MKILVTHSHLDHSPLAAPLSQSTGAPVLAAGSSDWGRRPVMQSLAASGLIGGGEGVDEGFVPDEPIAGDDTIDGSWGRIEVIATPGHMANHLSFAWNDTLFSGDVVMGWSTSLVSPPDGDMTTFMASVRLLAERGNKGIFLPGHGDPVTNPADRCTELLQHRKARETQILHALSKFNAATADQLARDIYTDIPPALIPAAARNVLAHLIDLSERNLIATEGSITENAVFSGR